LLGYQTVGTPTTPIKTQRPSPPHTAQRPTYNTPTITANYTTPDGKTHSEHIPIDNSTFGAGILRQAASLLPRGAGTPTSTSTPTATNRTAPRQKPQRTGERLHVAGVTAPYKPKLKPTYVKAKTQPKTTTELSTRGSDILRKTRNSFKRNTGDHIIERVKRANNKTINEAKQMQVRIRKGKQGKYALTHINYDITHGHLEVWTQSANTADTNSDSRDDKARKAKEDT
jgi:hypothetical protein